MRVWLNQLDGSSSQVDIPENCTLKEFLAQHNLTGLRLVCQGSNVTASSFGDFPDNANLYIQGGLEGGKRKRKKKVYTTKKKNKHIHRKIKMGILNLYSVDGNTKFIQARVTWLNSARPALTVVLEYSWLSIGTDITADSAIPQSRWTPKQSRRTKKS